MKGGFFLKTPCPHCPFRTDIEPYLTPERVREIEISVRVKQQDFPCHKTTKCVDLDDGSSDMITTSRTKRCAGMAILCEKIEEPTQMMRIEERIGFYDRTKMDMTAPVFASFRAMREAQSRRARKKKGKR